MSATISTIASATLLGVDGWPVTVEVHVSGGLPGFTVVGQPDSACREARDRVRAAVQSSGLTWHQRRYTVNLAPTGLRKGGAVLDLAMAVGVLVATEQLALDDVRDIGFLGELGLDGAIRKVRGRAVARRRTRHRDRRGAACRAPSRRSSSTARSSRRCRTWPSWSPAFGATSRGRRFLEVDHAEPERRRRCRPRPGARSAARPSGTRDRRCRWPSPAHGRPTGRRQDDARPSPARVSYPISTASKRSRPRASTPRRRSGCPPAASFGVRRSAPRTTRPRRSRSSVVGRRACSPVRSRSRTPACCSSTSWPSSRPPCSTHCANRSKKASSGLSRADVKVALPARFLLVGAMNPCPCGLRSSPDSCRCSDGQLARYCRRVSGPLLDRFDLRIDVTRADPIDLLHARPAEHSVAVAGAGRAWPAIWRACAGFAATPSSTAADLDLLGAAVARRIDTLEQAPRDRAR